MWESKMKADNSTRLFRALDAVLSCPTSEDVRDQARHLLRELHDENTDDERALAQERTFNARTVAVCCCRDVDVRISHSGDSLMERCGNCGTLLGLLQPEDALIS